MPDKFVALDEYIEWPVGTNRSDQFTSFIPESMRRELEASVYSVRVDRVAKGTFSNKLRVRLRPDLDFVFYKALVGQYNGNDDVDILYRFKSTAKALGNPELTFSICVSKLPPLGAERGSLLEGDLELTIQTAITWDDSVDTIVIG